MLVVVLKVFSHTEGEGKWQLVFFVRSADMPVRARVRVRAHACVRACMCAHARARVVVEGCNWWAGAHSKENLCRVWCMWSMDRELKTERHPESYLSIFNSNLATFTPSCHCDFLIHAIII